MPESVSLGLAELARDLPIAIITGRSVADVRPRLGFEPQLRDRQSRRRGSDRAAAGAGEPGPRCAAPAHRRATHAELAPPASRSKTRSFSLALHYRLAPGARRGAGLHRGAPAGDRAGAEALRRQVRRQRRRPRAARQGRRACGAGAALGAGAAVFVGDDVNDEAVFMRAGRLADGPHRQRRPLSRAMYFLDSEARARARAAAHAGAARAAG